MWTLSRCRNGVVCRSAEQRGGAWSLQADWNYCEVFHLGLCMSFSIKLFKIHYTLQKSRSAMHWKKLVLELRTVVIVVPNLTWSWWKWGKSNLYAEHLAEGRPEPRGSHRNFSPKKKPAFFATMLAIYYFELGFLLWESQMPVDVDALIICLDSL